MTSVEHRLERTILELVRARGPEKSICPSEAARAVGDDGWRDLMEPARAVARDLAARGLVVVTAGGEVLSPAGEWHGPIRIRLP
ncbi:DUF3253 domain-containing protein [Lentzea sp. NPDC003310]|uniref:DUF3253 domain-containing protein n=1 Tax=Lentzea sp. NPDC003310 TaxID=3154447 RepID=UPI0033A80AB4